MENEKTLEEKIKEYEKRAEFRMKIGDYPNAIKEYEKMLEVDPKNVFALSNLGLMKHHYFKDNESGISYLEKAVELDPKAGFVYFNLAMMHREIGNLEDAVKNYKKVIEIDQNVRAKVGENLIELTCAAYHNLGVIYHEMDKFDDALRCLDNAISINSGVYEIYDRRALTKFRLRDFKGAIKDFEKSIELGNTDNDTIDSLIILKDRVERGEL